MKQVKYVLSVIIGLFFLTICSVSVNAGYIEPLGTYAVVTVKAKVPEGFEDRIIVGLTQEKTEVTFNVVLSKENTYENTLDVINNDIYILSARIESDEEYETNLPDKCRIENDQSELSFLINKKNPVETAIESIPHREENNSLPVVEEGEEIIARFFEKVNFIARDNKFEKFLELYTGDMFLKYYLDIESTNTRDQWDTMGNYEKFVYYITYIMPYSRLMKNDYEDAGHFAEELVAQKNMLASIEGGNEVYEAIVQLWTWHYRYWTHTGTFYNFFDYSMEMNIPSQDKTVSVLPQKSDKSKLINTKPDTVNLTENRNIEEKQDAKQQKGFLHTLSRYCNITTVVGMLSIFFLLLFPKLRKREEHKKGKVR